MFVFSVFLSRQVVLQLRAIDLMCRVLVCKSGIRSIQVGFFTVFSFKGNFKVHKLVIFPYNLTLWNIFLIFIWLFFTHPISKYLVVTHTYLMNALSRSIFNTCISKCLKPWLSLEAFLHHYEPLAAIDLMLNAV